MMLGGWMHRFFSHSARPVSIAIIMTGLASFCAQPGFGRDLCPDPDNQTEYGIAFRIDLKAPKRPWSITAYTSSRLYLSSDSDGATMTLDPRITMTWNGTHFEKIEGTLSQSIRDGILKLNHKVIYIALDKNGAWLIRPNPYPRLNGVDSRKILDTASQIGDLFTRDDVTESSKPDSVIALVPGEDSEGFEFTIDHLMAFLKSPKGLKLQEKALHSLQAEIKRLAPPPDESGGPENP